MMRLSAVPALITLLLVTSNVDAQQPGRGRGRGPFGGRGMPEGITFLVAVPEIQKELGLSSDQQELLDALQADLRDQRRGLFRGGFGSPRGGDERERYEESLRMREKMRERIQEFNRHRRSAAHPAPWSDPAASPTRHTPRASASSSIGQLSFQDLPHQESSVFGYHSMRRCHDVPSSRTGAS